MVVQQSPKLPYVGSIPTVYAIFFKVLRNKISTEVRCPRSVILTYVCV